ncbi:bromodomain adjacent to zinc finger domain protein 2B-like isoform X3 [Anneissia japonica]|uniref:bromodomain adjacent to zinc finger domain protein 2B-like isoform X3 n=1 Tax=Anneissia japonica TaxID=1529436 RepID=UPI001425A163|nr:bromodomain adjacent to zinc finger domain protein 2B-like isoform X3 [Anneissia japonica]
MEPVENSSSDSPLGTRSLFDSHRLGCSVYPSSGTSQEPFSMSSVPSAFSVISHGFPTANRTSGLEFGGLGSLRNESLGNSIPSPSATSTASHTPLSPSGGASWWTHPHNAVPGLGLSGSSLGLTPPSFSSLSKDSTVKNFESLFGAKNQKHANDYIGLPAQTPASPPSATKPFPSSAPSSEKRGRGRPRKSDSPRHADTSQENSQTDIGRKSAEETLSVAKEKQLPDGSPAAEPGSARVNANSLANAAFEPSGSEHSLENKKDASSSSDIDMEEDDEDDDDDDTTTDDLDEANESDNSDISSNDTEDSDDEEEEMETIMKTKKELELKQKELLEQEKRIKQQQREARERKKEKMQKEQQVKAKQVNDEREREEEQKKKAEQLTLQFEQQIKAQQQQLKIQKKMEAEKKKNQEAKPVKVDKSKIPKHKSTTEKNVSEDAPLNLSKRSSNSPSPFTLHKDNEELAKFVSTHEKLIARTTKQAAERIKVALKAKMVKPGARQIANEMMSKATARLREHASSKKAAKAQNPSKKESDSSDDDDDESLGDNSGDSDGDSGSDIDTDGDGDSDNDHLDTDAYTHDSADSAYKYYKRNMPSTSMYYDPGPIPQKRLRVTDVDAVSQPLQYGFRRQTIIRQLGPEDQVKGEVIYYGPCGKKLRNYPEVLRYLKRRQITSVGREHFSFSAKVKVGEYLNPRPDGGMGIVFEKLTAEELNQRLYSPPPSRFRIGRVGHKAAEKRRIARELARRAAEAKLKKKLEQEEMARRVQESKMKRKLERHQRNSAVREQRRLQALHMAEEKRRHKEMIRLHREQQKIMRMEQLRMEREMRAHQIFEDRRKRRQQIEAKKNKDAIKKAKERELRRQQAVLLKHQERERRKQHMLLVRALEARKKAEQKERVKEEKKNEKKMSRERKVQLKRMELHMMKELKKPVDDLKVIDPKLPLPELPRIPGVKLPGQAFADCIMIVEFMHNFGESLGLDLDDDVPSLNALQEGLLNNDDYNTDLLRFTVRLLRLAYEDPGLPDDPIRPKTAWGENILKVDINKKTMSEMLRLLLINVHGKEDELSNALKYLPFKALIASQKAAILGFLVNQLVCSKSVVQQIDESIEDMSGLRKDKWVVEGKLRKLRAQQVKKNSKSAMKPVVENGTSQSGQNTPDPTSSKSKQDDDEEDDDEKDEEEDDVPPEDVEEAAVEEEDDGMTSEELQKKIDRLEKQHGQFKCKVFNKSHSLRAVCYGQDRYRRRYFVLPHAGGVFVEGMESSELPDETVNTVVQVKEEQNDMDIKKEEETEVKMEGIDEESSKNVENEKEQVKQEMDIEMKEDVNDEVKEETKEDNNIVHKETDMLINDDKNMKIDNEELNDVTSKVAEDAKMEQEVVTKPKDEPNIVENGFAENGAAKPPIDADTLLPKAAEQSKLCDLLNVPKMIEETLRKELCENVECKDKDGKTIIPTKSQEKESVEGSKDSPNKSSKLEMNGGLLSYGALSQQDNPLLIPYPVVSGSPGFPTGLDGNVNGSTNPWFSLLPRIPCDEASLANLHVSDSSTSNTLKQSSLPMFNLPPYSIYQLPFPIMPMQPMNSFLNPYSFPGLTAMQMHPFMGLQGMSPTMMDTQAQALCSGFNSQRSTPCDDNASDDFAAEDAAIANMQKLLDEREAAPLVAVPDELRNGWFHIAEPTMIQSVIKNLNQRGIRERIMQKNFQKLSDYAYKATTKTDKHIESLECKEDNPAEMVGGAPVPESKDKWSRKILFAVQRGLIQSVETLEEKIYSASMQVKGWTLPEKISNQKCISSREQAELSNSNLLEIAKNRLLELEKSVERRYIKPPLSRNQPVSLLCVKSTTSVSQRTYDDEDDVCPALQKWRTAVGNCTAPSQVHVCIRTLEKCIAWEKSIMKVFCQLCRNGDNEALLLICDGCDKGFHTYCVVPEMETIPEGNWYCMECISKATGKPGVCSDCQKTGKLIKCDKCPRSYHADCLDPPLTKFPRGKWLCPPCIKAKDKAKSQKRKSKGKKEDSGRNTPVADTPDSKQKADTKPKSEEKSERRKNSKKLNPVMAPCKQLLTELEKHEKAEPFLYPVDLKRFPIYKKVIKQPMDLHTIRTKLKDGQYSCPVEFAIDVRTIFDNCETFNEDDSDVGFAGHQLRSYFEARWSDIERDL